jgi:hypothetical protein
LTVNENGSGWTVCWLLGCAVWFRFAHRRSAWESIAPLVFLVAVEGVVAVAALRREHGDSRQGRIREERHRGEHRPGLERLGAESLAARPAGVGFPPGGEGAEDVAG